METQFQYQNTAEFALAQDSADPLSRFRSQFHIPVDRRGRPTIYFCGNSLGPQPVETALILGQVMEQWRSRAVRGHFSGARPWIQYHKELSMLFAEILGAYETEVIPTGTLTANIHQLLAAFFRPKGIRQKILAIGGGFPSDRYALESFLVLRGLDPGKYLVQIYPSPGQDHLNLSQFEQAIQSIGTEIALVFFPAVQFATGQVLPIEEITRLAHQNGTLAGFDLAHAAGNIPLKLHDWEVDFAAWCGYKYLCGGPGNGAGIYAHERHVTRSDFQHLAGWWGNDPGVRFEMRPHFEPVLTAERFQLSNPAIFTLASMLAPLRMYHAASMAALRQKSIQLTGYLEFLLDQERASDYKIITPRSPHERGCQLSVRVAGDAAALAEELLRRGVVIDERPPDIIRIAPLPIYNTFHEAWRFAQIFKDVLAGSASR